MEHSEHHDEADQPNRRPGQCNEPAVPVKDGDDQDGTKLVWSAYIYLRMSC
ncbi:hypothetical protein ACE1SV_58710 [Streptomyces sennicomposti]